MYANVLPTTLTSTFKVVCETGFTLLVTARSKSELIDQAIAVVAEAKQQPDYQRATVLRAHRRGRYVPWSTLRAWIAHNQDTYVSLPDRGEGKLSSFPPKRQQAAALYYLKGGRLTV
jgi:hypothetical protein